MRLGERFRSSEQRLDLRALLRGDARREESLVDAEALGEERDRALGRAGLATLDLADVLLREASVGELDLGQPCGDAQGAHALAETGASGRPAGR